MNLDNTNIKPPFTVPQGYFERTEEQIMSEAKISEMSRLKNSRVSENYFDSLEEQILSSVALQNLNLKNTQTAPHGYFEDLEDQILNRVKIEGLAQPQVNDSYFDELENTILASVKIDQMKRLETSEVPTGYFDTLEEEILSKTSDKKETRFTLFKNVKVFRTAAAITLFGFLGYGVSLLNTEPKNELADISSTAMLAYLDEHALMEEDLEFILEGQDDYTLLTSDISDSEISAYLTENGM
jgi:hypothetical protein